MLEVRESTQAAITTINLNFSELGLGVPPIFFNFARGYPLQNFKFLGVTPSKIEKI